MNNKRATKRALLTSVMALVMCVVMLIGTTFAWFTDTASTGVNKIQAGTLQIGLEMKDDSGNWVDAEGQTLAWQKAQGAENEDVLWEPGCTYELPTLKITNKGNLALQFKVLINNISGDKKLLDAIDFTVEYFIDDSEPENLPVDINENTSIPVELPNPMTSDPYYEDYIRELGWTGIPLETAEYVDTNNFGTDYMCVKLSAHMKKDAGNEYQGKTLNDFAITVVATQVAGYEHDSFNNTYDKDAEYPAITVGTTLDDVFTGLTDKDGNGVDFGVNAPAKDVSVNGQGIATVTGFADAWVAGDVTIKGVKFLNGACFTAKENGTVGTLTLEDCTFYACDQSKIDLAPYAYNSLKNSGDGLCLNVDTKDSPNLKVVIKNCRFIGENDPTLNRDGWKDIGGTNWDPDTAVKNKSRGHAVMINGICGGGNNATAESVLIEGCTMDGIRGHAIQLYQLRMGVTVKDCTINSWGNNAQTAAGTKSDAAIRGDIVVGSGNLTVTNTRFGLNESTSLRHINVDNYSGNTNGSRVAGTY
ncbi:MAG: SipW-dependent-type signal peptide-containing protein [Oscillibacter sp.]|nr:SipW-dependent-type signal peptide-containing protein [Oscillibacter sp.]